MTAYDISMHLYLHEMNFTDIIWTLMSLQERYSFKALHEPLLPLGSWTPSLPASGVHQVLPSRLNGIYI